MLLVLLNVFIVASNTSYIDESLDWRRVQTLVRSMPGLHKTLILACVKPIVDRESEAFDKECGIEYSRYKVEELAIASEHAPFKHKTVKGVGMQVKHVKN